MRSNGGAPKWSGLGTAKGLVGGSAPSPVASREARGASDDAPRSVFPRRVSDAARLTAIERQELVADGDVYRDQRDHDEPDRDPRHGGQDRHDAPGARVTAQVGDEAEQRDEAGARTVSAESGEPGDFRCHQLREFARIETS